MDGYRRLILIVKLNPALWDETIKEHYAEKELNAAWDAVGSSMQPPVSGTVAFMRFRYLREKFEDEYYNSLTKNGKPITWQYFEDLSFLSRSIDVKNLQKRKAIGGKKRTHAEIESDDNSLPLLLKTKDGQFFPFVDIPDTPNPSCLASPDSEPIVITSDDDEPTPTVEGLKSLPPRKCKTKSLKNSEKCVKNEKKSKNESGNISQDITDEIFKDIVDPEMPAPNDLQLIIYSLKYSITQIPAKFRGQFLCDMMKITQKYLSKK